MTRSGGVSRAGFVLYLIEIELIEPVIGLFHFTFPLHPADVSATGFLVFFEFFAGFEFPFGLLDGGLGIEALIAQFMRPLADEFFILDLLHLAVLTFGLSFDEFDATLFKLQIFALVFQLLFPCATALLFSARHLRGHHGPFTCSQGDGGIGIKSCVIDFMAALLHEALLLALLRSLRESLELQLHDVHFIPRQLDALPALFKVAVAGDELLLLYFESQVCSTFGFRITLLLILRIGLSFGSSGFGAIVIDGGFLNAQIKQACKFAEITERTGSSLSDSHGDRFSHKAHFASHDIPAVIQFIGCSDAGIRHHQSLIHESFQLATAGAEKRDEFSEAFAHGTGEQWQGITFGRRFLESISQREHLLVGIEFEEVLRFEPGLFEAFGQFAGGLFDDLTAQFKEAFGEGFEVGVTEDLGGVADALQGLGAGVQLLRFTGDLVIRFQGGFTVAHHGGRGTGKDGPLEAHHGFETAIDAFTELSPGAFNVTGVLFEFAFGRSHPGVERLAVVAKFYRCVVRHAKSSGIEEGIMSMMLMPPTR